MFIVDIIKNLITSVSEWNSCEHPLKKQPFAAFMPHIIRGTFLPALVWTSVFMPASAQSTSPPVITGLGISPAGTTANIHNPNSGSTTLFWTTDGTNPTTSSHSSSGSDAPVEITEDTIINAFAVDVNGTSPVSSLKFIVDPTTAAMNLVEVLTGPSLWYRSDSGVIIDGSNAISSWTDARSGIAMIQSNGVNQPTLVPNDFDGLPSVNFTSNQFLQKNSGSRTFSRPALYMVTKPISSTNGVIFDTTDFAGENRIAASIDSVSSTFRLDQGLTSGSITASAGITPDQYNILSMVQKSNQGAIYVNGVLQTSGTLTDSTATLPYAKTSIGSNTTGTTDFYDGRVLEVIAYGDGIIGLNPDLYLHVRYQPTLFVPAAPIISVPSSSLSGPTQVAIATEPDCDCFVTTDGTDPNTSSQKYIGPLNIYFSQTLKAIAVRNGVPSSIASSDYDLDSLQWPAPASGDTTPLQMNIEQPTD